MKLPKAFMEKGTELKSSKLFGHALEDLSREELIAAADIGWHNYQTLQKEVAMRDVQHMNELAAASRNADSLFDSVFGKSRDKGKDFYH